MAAERARDTRLTEDEVVRTALRLVEEAGAERLSMRKLADELGVTAMAIYHYVRSRDELLQLVADSVLRDIGRRADGTWQERIEAHFISSWQVLSQYPGLAAFCLGRPLSPQAREGVDYVIGLLREAGFDPVTAEMAFETYHTYSYGLVAMQTQFGKGRHPEGRRRLVEFGIRTWIAGLEARLAEGSAVRTAP